MKIKSIPPDESEFLQVSDTIALKHKRLYFIGSLPKKRLPTVAIVGTRKPTHYGTETTLRLAEDLAKRGVVIVSGLAFGIDAVAHRAALSVGGITIAVLAGGLDAIYPASHRQLAEDIVKGGGALVSEYPPGTPSRAFQFLARNRIVSGLSDAVIVTEAAARSGTLSTVMHALDQNKEVFAVPGNITSPMSVGPNRLIQQGAHPVLSANDVLEIIAPERKEVQTMLALGQNALEAQLLELLRSGIRDGDLLQQRSTMTAQEFSQTLTMLEIQGIIKALGANRWVVT